MESGDVLKKGQLDDPSESDKPEEGSNKEGNSKKRKSKKGKNKAEAVEAKPTKQVDPPADNQLAEAEEPHPGPQIIQDEHEYQQPSTIEALQQLEGSPKTSDQVQQNKSDPAEQMTEALSTLEDTQASESTQQAKLAQDVPIETQTIGDKEPCPLNIRSQSTELQTAAESVADPTTREPSAISQEPAPPGLPCANLLTDTQLQTPEQPTVDGQTSQGTNFAVEKIQPSTSGTNTEAKEPQQSAADKPVTDADGTASMPVQPSDFPEHMPVDSKALIPSQAVQIEATPAPEPAPAVKPESQPEDKVLVSKQSKEGDELQKPAPSPKKAKASKATKEDYLAVRGILDKWKQKVTKAESSKKSKLTLLQESLAKTQELQRKLAQETRSRDADKAAKEAILAQMEAENGAFLKQLDVIKKQTPVAAIKETVFKKQVECRKEELQKKLEELKPAQNLFAERLRLQAELGQHHKQQLRLTREVEKHTSLITVLEHKEKDALERLKVSGTDYEAEKLRVEAAIRQDSDHIARLEAEDLTVLRSIDEAVERARSLEVEIQAIRREEFEFREKFEADNKFNREECARLRTQLLNREVKNEELKQENVALDQKCQELSQEITRTVANIKELHAASKTNTHVGNNNLKLEKSQREALEKLLHEKNELKAEIDRLSREKGKLTVIVKDLGEVRALRESNLSLLIEFVASLDHTDRMSVEKEMTTNLNPKSVDIKRLVKSTVGRNIELKYEIERLEKECVEMGLDCADH